MGARRKWWWSFDDYARFVKSLGLDDHWDEDVPDADDDDEEEFLLEAAEDDDDDDDDDGVKKAVAKKWNDDQAAPNFPGNLKRQKMFQRSIVGNKP
jgi:hypothetical protein